MSKFSPAKPRLLGYEDLLPTGLTVQKSFEDVRHRIDGLEQAAAAHGSETLSPHVAPNAAVADLREDLHEIAQGVNQLLEDRITVLRQHLTTVEHFMRGGLKSDTIARATNAVSTAFAASGLEAQPRQSREADEKPLFEETCAAVAAANRYEVRTEPGCRLTLSRNGLQFSIQVSPIPSILGIACESRIMQLVVRDERSGEELMCYENHSWAKMSTDLSAQAEIDRVIAIFA